MYAAPCRCGFIRTTVAAVCLTDVEPTVDMQLLLELGLVPQKLAQQQEISTNRLLSIINEKLHVNLYDIINGYRVGVKQPLLLEASENDSSGTL